MLHPGQGVDLRRTCETGWEDLGFGFDGLEVFLDLDTEG